MDKKGLLRQLPKIDELLNEDLILKELNNTERIIVVDSLRESIDLYRKGILQDEIHSYEKEEILNYAIKILNEKKKPNLKKVINATGIVIHTNLGRSLLSDGAIKNVIDVSNNYNNLEYDISSGKRGSRYSHIEDIVTKITGAESALVVNNNAAAIMLVLDTLCKNKEAIVSRGQLVEIGGSFRIPEVMKFSGAKLVEVGTTNRTHLYDYENNINENTGILLKVHTSNFKIYGFTEEVDIESLVKLGNDRDIPVVEDIGSGVLIDFSKYGFTHEPTVQESIKRGVDIVTFSGDKMLGGPQAGIIVGKKKYIDLMKKNQLTRALRIDKMTLAALEGTLKYYLDEKSAIENIPSLNMILASKEDMKKKAMKLKKKLSNITKSFEFSIILDASMVGGGSMPTEKIETYVIKAKSKVFSANEMEEKLRNGDIPIITRIFDDELILDVRTIFEKDFDTIVKAFLTMESK
ncbi:MAG: L-seryl-tRNA(Sec) selenium transferase [Clostridium argentinense]|uniref:L-seryl-tRNA(Sec) selenium transferase n=1 Tax=Clostridium faecium TaxID=2762223 RepID=A0ABR8YS21_9CLOT|nr:MULTISPECIES: L-seryl-tRNA(Sec) selenium transferase [Clostridium]MBD8047054.1 L-seryl-tRNA(Sec) selenium transferase [Clostridium faecium]MBS5825234.1 L-seryl-tRNA(Sec) selenium transferase [Clostridium argentinense]MDU1348218.1 L-seryl-tRNA(Sec) selenium transferase [Clostridium argentinense]